MKFNDWYAANGKRLAAEDLSKEAIAHAAWLASKKSALLILAKHRNSGYLTGSDLEAIALDNVIASITEDM